MDGVVSVFGRADEGERVGLVEREEGDEVESSRDGKLLRGQKTNARAQRALLERSKEKQAY